MKKNIYHFLPLITLIIVLSACRDNFQPENIKHVVIIGIDGMSVGGLEESHTPNFDEYIKNGAWSFHARNVLPTSSSPNWGAMLTGSGVALTGITSNDWRYNNYKLPPVVTTENGRYPDIFYAVKKSKPEYINAAVYDWSGFANLYDKNSVDIDHDTRGELLTAEKAAEVIKSEKPNFLFIQLDHVDHAGHALGHMTPGYLQAVERADSLTGIIVDAAREAGIFDATMFLVVADHGGVGFGHGHETVQGNEVPFILYGSGIKKGYEIPAAVNLYDVAATSAFALNITAPQVWQGRPVECAFKGSGEPDPETLIGKFMAQSTHIPVIYPKKKNGEAGGLFIGENATVTLETRGTDGKIRYTTDGSIPTIRSSVYNQPFELTVSGVVRAAYFGDDGSQSTFSEGFFRVVNEVTENTGVRYRLYRGEKWEKLPDFTRLKALEEGRVFEFSTDELADRIGDNTGIVFEGYLLVEQEGSYTFTTKSDDGSKLYVNGKQVVNNDGDHGVTEKEGSVYLKQGKNKIRVEHFNGGGGFFLNATYKGPDIPKQIISPDRLTIN